MREESAVRRFPAQLKNLAKIRRFVSEVAARVGMTADAISDVLLAVDEATTNIITHGYAERAGEIEVEVRRAGNSLFVHLRDDAPPFDPSSVPAPALIGALQERQPGGMGVWLIHQMVDEVIWRHRASGGNELTLIKHGGENEMESEMGLSTVLEKDGVTVIAITGDVDADTSSTLENTIVQVLETGQNRLVLDFSGVDFLASAGLRVILNAQQRAHARGGEVRLCALHPHVFKVFEMVGFNQMFTITNTRDDALRGW